MAALTMDRSVSDYVSSFARIEALQAEARELLQRIQDLYLEIGQIASGGGGTVRRGRPRGRPRSTGRRAAVKTSRKGRAPRGALKEAIHKVLAGGEVIRPAEIVKELSRVGYKTASNPRVFYTNVYLALKRDKGIKKTAKGFRLRAASK